MHPRIRRSFSLLCSVATLSLWACSSSQGPGQPAEPGAPLAPKVIRAFAVSNRVLFRDGESIESFEAKMRALFDKRLRTGDIVQDGVDDVASHLLGPTDPHDPVGTARDLVVFTEDVGLVLAFQGTRAASIRDPSLSAVDALTRIALMHLPQVLLNLATFDVSLNRALFLSLTDTFWRGFHQTFSRIADDYDVYVAACENVADVYESTDPVKIRIFGDPEHPERTNVFLPMDGNVYNQTVLYDPDGRIVAKTRKVYLTPPEEDPSFFDLSSGSIEDLEAIDTPLGRLVVMISKDAWMADVIDRADEMGAQIVIQPDANPGRWAAVVSGNETWFPDNWAAGNWMHTQKYPSVRYNITPMMTGNLYDFNFDGQASIMADTRPSDTRQGFVGQWPRPGFLAVGRWAQADPGDEQSGLSMAERRRILMARSEAMAPRSGSLLENAYAESVVYADLEMPAAPVLQRPSSPPLFGENVAVAPGRPGPCWRPSIGVSAQGVVSIVWTDLSRGAEEVLAVESLDGGATFSEPVRVEDSGPPRARHRGNHWRPRVAVSPADGRRAAVWTDFRSGSWEIFLSCTRDTLFSWSSPATRVDDAGDAARTGENLLYDPAVAWDEAGNLFVVWSDNRTVSDTDIVLRKSADGGVSFGPEVRVDDTGDGTLDDERGATGVADSFAFKPDITARGNKVYVVWQDMREGWNEIFFARSDDGGRSFGANRKVKTSSRPFCHHYDPSVAVDGAGTVYVAWQDACTDAGDIYLAVSTDGGEHFGQPIRVDDSGDSSTTQSYPRVAAAPSGEIVYVLWRDERYGNPDLFVTAARLGQGKGFGVARMVNDELSAPYAQSPAEMAVDSSGNALITWHDSRTGSDAVYFARGRID